MNKIVQKYNFKLLFMIITKVIYIRKRTEEKQHCYVIAV